MKQVKAMLIMVHDYIFKSELSKSEKEAHEMFETALDTTARIMRLRQNGEHVPEEYATASLNAVRILTVQNMSLEYREKYQHLIQRIIKGETAEAQPANKPITTDITEPPKKRISAPKPKTKAVRIKRGTSELKLEENLNTRLLYAIRAEPQKNPYKQLHGGYFRARIEEQKAIMQTHNPNPRETQEQKDAYYSFQIDTLAASACSPTKWSGLEQECANISQELSREPNYNAQKLLEFYGIEMTSIKIIPKERLPDELVRIMNELL